jgi:hypothetical protein
MMKLIGKTSWPDSLPNPSLKLNCICDLVNLANKKTTRKKIKRKNKGIEKRGG